MMRAGNAPVDPPHICSMFRRLDEEKLGQEMENDFRLNSINTTEKNPKHCILHPFYKGPNSTYKHDRVYK